MTNDNLSINRRESGSGCVIINNARFTLDGVIHQGSASRIFSAHSDEGGGDPVFVMPKAGAFAEYAIKCYTCRRDSDEWDQAMREIEAGKMLKRCPEILRLEGSSVLTDGEGEFRVFLLFHRVQSANALTLSPVQCAALGRDICRALGALRRKGLVHGDVKPSNIFRGEDRWLLGDFGSVCRSGEIPRYGTEGYCSPEAANGLPCDIRSDIYSLGITLYRLLSGGRLPFCTQPCAESDEQDVYRAIQRRLTGEVFLPPEGTPAALAGLLTRMCRYDKRLRPHDPFKLAGMFERALF